MNLIALMLKQVSLGDLFLFGIVIMGGVGVGYVVALFIAFVNGWLRFGFC